MTDHEIAKQGAIRHDRSNGAGEIADDPSRRQGGLQLGVVQRKPAIGPEIDQSRGHGRIEDVGAHLPFGGGRDGIAELTQQRRADTGEVSHDRVKNLRNAFKKALEDYVGSTQIHLIGQDSVDDLLARDLTQIDWLNERKGWRLSAAIKALGYLGWEPISIMIQHIDWPNPIARYSLHAKAKQAAHTLRQGGAHAQRT